LIFYIRIPIFLLSAYVSIINLRSLWRKVKISYKEEIFERLEMTNFSTINEIEGWLAGPKRNEVIARRKPSYRNFAIQLQEPLNIIAAAEETESIDELFDLEVEADAVDVSKSKTLRVVRRRMAIASRDIGLPRAPRQPEISRTSEYSDLFQPMMDEISQDKFFPKDEDKTGIWQI